MTEEEWLNSTKSEMLLEYLDAQQAHLLGDEYYREGSRARKWRLLTCALCRRVEQLLDDTAIRVIETVEQFAEGEVAFPALEEAHRQGYAGHRAAYDAAYAHFQNRLASLPQPALGVPVNGESDIPRAMPDAMSAVEIAARTDMFTVEDVSRASSDVAVAAAVARFAESNRSERVAHASLIREVVGNPFRPVAFQSTWRSPAVAALAQAVYADRLLPSGLFDNQRLSVLADALEDVGCDSAELLGHLRNGEDHVRGCWAVDLILGKE